MAYFILHLLTFYVLSQIVQVEKRQSESEKFGQNRTRTRQITMTVKEFVDKLSTPESDLLYLSTQHTSEDESSTNPFQPPCAQLLATKKLDPSLSWAGNLRLESCNMWMGSSKAGTCSGLHHDYHDNFYILVAGTKQFRLYSPDTVPYMDMYGAVERVHFNGVVSYVGSETRADGMPIALLKDGMSDTGLAKGVTKDDESGDSDEDSNDDKEDGVEFVLGKGFDYQSSEEEENEDDFDENGHDDFDELVGNEGDDSDVDSDIAGSEEGRPNSFSRIDPLTANSEDHSLFATCKECIVELTAGDVLYLPAGWMHSVTSFSADSEKASNDKNYHLAFNYWYHPPDQLDTFESPYQHNLEGVERS